MSKAIPVQRSQGAGHDPNCNAKQEPPLPSMSVECERLASLLRAIPDVVVELDGELMIRYAGPSIERILGYKPEEVLSGSLLDLVHPDDLPSVRRTSVRLMKAQVPLRLGLAFRIRRKDGGWRYTEGVCNSVSDKPGRPTAVITLRDVTRQKRSETKAAESGKYYEALIEHSGGGVAAIKGNRYAYVNQRFLDIFGFRDRTEITGKPVAVIADQKDAGMLSEICATIQKGEPVASRYEFKGRRKNGSIVYIEISGVSTLYWGRPASLVYLRDVTEQKQVEEKLTKSEATLRSVFLASPVGTILIGTGMMINSINHRINSITGYSPEELIGISTRILYPTNEEFVRVEEVIHKDVEQCGMGTIDTRWMRKNGEIRNVFLSASTLNAGGISAGTVLTAVDITERKQAEQRLLESEERYRTTIENSNDGIALIRRGEHIYVNQKYVAMFGYDREDEILGKPVQIVVHPGDKERVRAYNEKRLRGEYAPHTYEFKGIEKDGRSLLVEVSVAATVYLGERVSLAFLRDITRRKKAEEELILDETRLESLLKISKYRAGSTEDLLDFALEEAIELTGSKVGYIYFYDESSKEFTLNSWSKGVMDECAVINPQTRYRLDGTGIWGEAVRQREPIIINDYQSTDTLKKGYPEGHVKLEKFLTIPVLIQDRIVAVVGVANKSIDYDQSDVRQLTLLMDSVWQYVELKKVEEKVRRAAQEWRTTFDSIKDQVILLDRDLKIIRVNKATLSFLNLPFHDILGRSCHKVIYQREDPPATCPLAKILETRKHEEAEVYIDSRSLWVSVSVDPVFDGNREMIGIVHIIKDITERRRAEEAVRKSEEKHRDIFENAMEGIFQATPEGKFISANPSLARMHGFDSPEEMITSVNDIARRLFKNREDLVCYLKTLRTQGVIKRHEAQLYRKDGSLFWASMSARIVKDTTGSPLYYEGTVEDITQRKTAEMSLRNVLYQLEQKNKELEDAYAELKKSQEKIFQQEKMASIGQLAAGVAHEINNPMGFIISNLNALQKYMKRMPEFIKVQDETIENLLNGGIALHEHAARTVADARRTLKIDYILEDSQSLIAESLDGADRVKRIVQDLKGFSRADNAEHVLADVNKSVESALNIVWNELKYKTTVTKDYGEVPLTMCNPGQLSQVFVNILVNASQAIEETGEIAIKTAYENGSIYVAISDTGTGIPETQLNRIFDPFFTTKDVGKGTGLGLSIVYDIVKKHKGEIEVKSEVGKGTTFAIRIPVEAT